MQHCSSLRYPGELSEIQLRLAASRPERERSMARGRTPSLVFAVAFVANWCCVETALAQTATSGSAAPMTTEERLAVENAALSDARVRAIVGEGQPRIITTGVEADKAETEAFLEGRSTTPPRRLVSVVLSNPQTNQAAHALVSLSERRVISAESISASDIPYVRGDADQALVLAKADAGVRRAVGDTLDRYEILESGSDARLPFAAQALPLRSTDPRDVCSVDRCLDLTFRTENGYLPVRAHINLTRRTVEVHGGGQHR